MLDELTASQAPCVQEDGEHIGIGQRLSKFTKLSINTPSEKRAIAEKIFKSVDIKAAEPKTKESGGKGISRASQLLAESLTLTPEERKIVKSPLEILLIHNSDGRLKSVTLGTEKDVTIPLGTAANAILSHNHPGGKGPSDSDIKMLLSHPGRTLRIVVKNEQGRHELFSMQTDGSFSEEETQALASGYGRVCIEQGDTHSARRFALELLLGAVGGRLSIVSRIFS